MSKQRIDTAELPSWQKPRLILRVGGIGNRKFGSDNGITESPAELKSRASAALKTVFTELESVLVAIQREDREYKLPSLHSPRVYRWFGWLPGLLFSKPDPWSRLTPLHDVSVFDTAPPLAQILTGAAEGGDLWIWEEALARNSDTIQFAHFRISVDSPEQVTDGIGIGSIEPRIPTPAHEPCSRKDAHERAENARARAYGFRAQSEAVRHHSDILIAVWDPDTEGKAGGTSESVLAALRERIPVIAIRLHDSAVEGISVLQSPEDLDAPPADWRMKLGAILRSILHIPDGKKSEHHQSESSYHPRAAFMAFCSGKPLRRLWPGLLWNLFETHTKLKSLSQFIGHLLSVSKAIYHTFVGIPAPRQTGEPGTYQYHYGWIKTRADREGMSSVYGDAHRGGIIASHFLAALAVTLAIVGALFHHAEGPAPLLVAVAIAEAIIIILMWALSTCSTRDDWHEAYTDSRTLVEALKLMEPLGPLGVHTPLPRLPHYLIGTSKHDSAESTWAIWYFRALVRMAPLRLQPAAHLNLADHREKELTKWIASQTTYHKNNAAKHHGIHNFIEWLGFSVFVIIFIAALIHVREACIHTHDFHTLTVIICIVGPALISAIHGFASQLEVQRLQQRSRNMVRILAERLAAINGVTIPAPGTPLSAKANWGLTTEALKTASILMDETAGWSLLYKNTDIQPG